MPISVLLSQARVSGAPRSSPSHEPAGGLARQVNREVVVLLGWGKAILLQLAHPLVAAGVGEHSDFGGGPISYVRRTRRTVGAMLALTFGSEQEIRQRAARINAIHRRVHGVLQEPTGHFPVGMPYTATDPELLRWVHATLVASQLNAYELFVGGLTNDEKDEYCAEAAGIAPLLAIPERFLPADAEALERYLEKMFTSGVIEVTDTARTLGRALLFPPGGALTGPLLGLGRLASIGLLPPAIRAGYGFAWDERSERRLRRAARVIRHVRTVLPALVREWPAARRTGSHGSAPECPIVTKVT